MEEELKKLLEQNNLLEYIDILKKEKILGIDDLKSLTQDDYKEIGIEALGDRKKFLKLFSSDKSDSDKNQISNEISVIQSEEPFVDTTRNGKKFCFKTSEPDKLFCRKCHASVSEFDSLCWNCNESLTDNIYPFIKSSENDSISKNPENLVINNNLGSGGNGVHTGVAGLLGGIIGAVAVIVIILIILSNESWYL